MLIPKNKNDMESTEHKQAYNHLCALCCPSKSRTTEEPVKYLTEHTSPLSNKMPPDITKVG